MEYLEKKYPYDCFVLCNDHQSLLNVDDFLICETQQAEFLIHFEAWAKLAQQLLVCVSLGIHLEPINKDLMLLVTI